SHRGSNRGSCATSQSICSDARSTGDAPVNCSWSNSNDSKNSHDSSHGSRRFESLMAVKKTIPKRAKRARPRGAALKTHAAVILDRLLKQYPNAHCALDFTNAFQLLCATILSAQCTDKRVNMVTPTLFAKY